MRTVTKKQMKEMYDDLSKGLWISSLMSDRYGISLGSTEFWSDIMKITGNVGYFGRIPKSAWNMEEAADEYHSAQWALVAVVSTVSRANKEHPDKIATAWLDSFEEVQ